MSGKKGKMSDETRKKIAEKQKQRWARAKASEKVAATEKARRSKKTAQERNAQIKWADFLVVFESQMGMLTKSCKLFGCTTADVYRRLGSDPEFKEKYDTIRKAKLLEVEDALFKAIKEGKVDAIKFYLSCNGYSPVQKLEANVKQDVKIMTIDPFEKK